MIPAARDRFGAAVTKINVAAGYHCRGRVGGEEAKLSEHAFANAIDVSAFDTTTGSVTVQGDWGAVTRAGKNVQSDAAASRLMPAPTAGAPPNVDKSGCLRRILGGGCATFSTALGPNANDVHIDHFHFDAATRHSGAYCG